MQLIELAALEMAYTSLQWLDFDVGRQFYGTVEGPVTGERLAGNLRLTNFAVGRPDGVNLPTLRGVLTTTDGASIWVQIDGIATLRPSDHARIIAAALQFRTGNAQYAWLNTVLGVMEGVLNTDSGGVHGHWFECRPQTTRSGERP